MSFICDQCKKAKPAHSKPVRIVLKTRDKAYPARAAVGSQRSELSDRFEGRPARAKPKGDPGGQGWEIVEEGSFCDDCASTISRATLSGRESFEVALNAAPGRWISK